MIGRGNDIKNAKQAIRTGYFKVDFVIKNDKSIKFLNVEFGNLLLKCLRKNLWDFSKILFTKST